LFHLYENMVSIPMLILIQSVITLEVKKSRDQISHKTVTFS